MLESRQQKPISPQEMFSRLLSQSYKDVQCQQQCEKIKKKKLILIELIQQYEQSIHSQVIKINQLGNLQKLRLQKIDELARLKQEREIIQTSVHEQLNNIIITPNQHQEKHKLTLEFQQVHSVNNKIKFKLKDLHQYIQKLQMHNQSLSFQKNILQTKVANRMRVNSEDWKSNVQALRRKQQLEENNMKTKILQKESENIKNIRKQQEQIYKRNQQKWDDFRKTAFSPNILQSYETRASKQVQNFASRKFPERVYQGYRVI